MHGVMPAIPRYARYAPLLLATALTLALAAALAPGAPFLSSQAEARSCERVKLRVYKRITAHGRVVLVRHRTCGQRSRRALFVRVRGNVKGAHRWRRVAVTTARVARLGAQRAVSRGPSSRQGRIAYRDSRPSGKTAVSRTYPSCELDDHASPAELALPGCRVVASDTSAADPTDFWGTIECETASRHQRPSSGGDPHTTATGVPQGDDAYRRLTVLDGDDFYGERCELGKNDHRDGPTAFYREGMRRVTAFSVRLPDSFPLHSEKWQTVMQMKQAQPSADDLDSVVLELQVIGGRWEVSNGPHTSWAFPAQRNVWTRFVFDVHYSDDPDRGWFQVSADLNADGDIDDAGERSPRIGGATLATEVEGGHSIPVGEAIPSHLRAGIYHDRDIACSSPTGCAAEIDNVQVIAD